MNQTERKKRIQTRIGAKPDGIIGPNTLTLLEVALGIGDLAVANMESADLAMAPKIKFNELRHPKGTTDSRAKKVLSILNGLEPPIQQLFAAAYEVANEVAAEQDAHYYPISGFRSYEEQDALYAKGRTAPGEIVTKARAGYSDHNFGIAVDFGAFDAKTGKYLDSSDPERAKDIHRAVANEIKKEFPSIEWGGDWKSFVDIPHYAYKTGFTLAQMRDRVAKGLKVV